MNTASGEALGKHSFPTHQEGEITVEAERGKERRLLSKSRGEKRDPSVFVAVPPPSATLGSSSQQATPTPRRRAQSRLLELECHVAINGRIPMTIAPGAEKPISPHAVRFSQAIGVFVEHQMLTTLKEFWADCHRHFKKYSNPEEARANSPNALEQSRTNKVGRQKQPYNHSSGSKSFLQRQYELAERKGKSVDRVELFRETHVQVGTFVSQAAEDAHNQMLELQSQPTPEGSQPLSEDEIYD
ncbi:CACTA en-spm transposon protein [Cucumis melo var. makuwa]|uniref:CACTA en-spm transposon protein n=1 Tax=Cucumis melo var. makuwa TaxID=1194695 RepID=A0A5A7V8S8_CUCMM|nr:CACTA en-spm transposon protein [Cucumis melo var. makuwa]